MEATVNVGVLPAKAWQNMQLWLWSSKHWPAVREKVQCFNCLGCDTFLQQNNCYNNKKATLYRKAEGAIP
jgi:hypothetical protein